MKDLEGRFTKFKEDNEYLGDIIIMSLAVEKMRYSKEIIRKSFNNLVSDEEYEGSDKNEIINYLYQYSNE